MSADLHDLLAAASRLLRRGSYAAPPLTGFLERPAADEPAPAAIFVHGWLFNRGSAIASIGVRLDGGNERPLSFGIARPDVAAEFPGEFRAAHAGFSGMVPLPTPIPGTHRIEVWAQLRNGERHLAFQRTVETGRTRPSLTGLLTAGLGRLGRRRLPSPAAAPPPPPFIEPPPAPPIAAAPVAAPIAAPIPPPIAAPIAEPIAAPILAPAAAPIPRVAPPSAPRDPSPLPTAARAAALSFFVERLRPRTAVELEAGDAAHYQSLCAAVDQAQLTTSCYGVGAHLDPGATLRHERLAKGSSSLTSSSSEEALRHFTNGTVDLLILRAHDRPLADMLSHWSSKLSRRALVLVPDVTTSAPARAFFGGAERLYRHLHLRAADLGVLFFHGASSAAAFEPLAAPTAFPDVDRPCVSIIIPAYGQLRHTLTCLESLVNTPSELSYEVIVVDDGSLDATPDLLPHIPGLHVVTLEENRGYPIACNRGAAIARGDYLVFLNNDTRVTPRWLEELHATYRHYPDAGLIGSKLVLGDGTLQEAGCMIWNDGSAMNVGRGEDPDRPEYNYVRDVDYCSGASVILRTDLYRRLGGFDPFYSPGYYEDGDLCFKIRALGLRVLYQPLSRVNHKEGGTAGTDVRKGVKRYQVINQDKFLQRWRDRIATHGPRPPDESLAYDRLGGDHVLVIDHVIPRRDQDSGSVRMFNLIALLAARGCKVTFAADNLERLSPYTEELQRIGVEVLYRPHVASIEEHLARMGARYQLVLLSKRDPAWNHLATVRRLAPHALVAFDTVDLHFVREAREAEVKHDRDLARIAREGKERELDLCRRADCTLVVSEAERELLHRELGPIPIEIIGNIQDLHQSPHSFAERADLLFVGYFTHTPNADAMLYFLREIFPAVRRRLPGVKLRIVGKDPPPELTALAAEDVLVCGHVPDLEPYLFSSRLMVAPLRFGAGVKGKVTQSLSYGLPVVATPVAAEGMGLTDGETVLIAAKPADLANQIVRLYTDEPLWTRLSQNGFAHARAHFSADAVRNALDRLVDLLRRDRAPRAAQAAE